MKLRLRELVRRGVARTEAEAVALREVRRVFGRHPSNRQIKAIRRRVTAVLAARRADVREV